MYTFVFRFILGVLALAAAARAGQVFKMPVEQRDRRLVNFFWFFFFLTLHQFAWSMPFTYFENSAMVAFYSYFAAIALYFVMLYFALKSLAQIFPQNEFLKNNILGWLTLLTGGVVLFFHFWDFTPPIMVAKFVIWQENIYAAWLSAIFGFAVAVIWATMFYKYLPSSNRANAVFLISGAAFLGLSCAVFFTIKTPLASVATFALVFLGLVCGLLSFFWPKK